MDPQYSDKRRSRRTELAKAIRVAAACMALMLGVPAVGQGNGNGRGGGGGGGGGGDPLDTGTVYFWSNDFDSGVFTAKSINPDGTSVTTLDIASPSLYTDPSDSLHAGARWFLMAGAIDGEAYPDGQQRLEMTAVSDGGAVIQISVDATLQMILPNGQIDMSFAIPRWTLNDSRVSWMARRWGTDPDTGEAVIVETGLYYVNLPDEVSSLGAPLVPQRFAFDFAEVTYEPYGIQPDLSGYDWSPDGARIVLSDPLGLSVVNPDTGAGSIVLAAGATPIWCPRWSVLDQIVFSDWDGLQTINIDGTGLSQIVTGELDRGDGRPGLPHWSPNGTHLVYQRLFARWHRRHGLVVEWKTFVCDATGGNDNHIAGGADSSAIPLGWAQD